MPYNKFTQTVIDIIKSIPKGKVFSYGMIAKMAGNPRAARQVSWVLHSLTEKHNLPWWRVVNSKGNIALTSGEGKSLQRSKLEEEGVEFIGDYRVDLSSSIWRP